MLYMKALPASGKHGVKVVLALSLRNSGNSASKNPSIWPGGNNPGSAS